MKFKTKVTEVEAVRWDGPSYGFWNGLGTMSALSRCESGRTWLAEAMEKHRDDAGAIWAGDGVLHIERYAEDGEYPGPWTEKVQPGMWLVWSRGTIYVYSQEVFDRMYEAA